MSCRYRPSFSCLTEVTWQPACRPHRYCPRTGPGRPGDPPEHFGYRNLYAEDKWGAASMAEDAEELAEVGLNPQAARRVTARPAPYRVPVGRNVGGTRGSN